MWTTSTSRAPRVQGRGGVECRPLRPRSGSGLRRRGAVPLHERPAARGGPCSPRTTKSNRSCPARTMGDMTPTPRLAPRRGDLLVTRATRGRTLPIIADRRRPCRGPNRSRPMTNPSGTPENPLRVAIIGSGPAGFYAAGHLLNAKDARWRSTCSTACRRPSASSAPASRPTIPRSSTSSASTRRPPRSRGFRFFGNVDVGTDIQHSDLASRYHAVIYAVAPRPTATWASRARTSRAAIRPPSSWPGTTPTRISRPEFDLYFERAVVIGNGNVAMDVARMLALPRDQIGPTDIADHAIAPLADSALKEVMVVGRRGPAQAAFTNPELLELPELTVADVIVDPADATLDPHSGARSRARATSPRATSRSSRVRRAASPRAGRSGSPALPALAGRDPGRRQGRGHRAGRNEL